MNIFKKHENFDFKTELDLKKEDLLNASSFYDGKKYYIGFTTYDLKYLDNNDLKALLSHEIGHAKISPNKIHETFYTFMYSFANLIFMILAIIPVKYQILNHLGLRIRMIISIIVSLSLLMPFVTSSILCIPNHKEEFLADIYGAKLVGYSSYIHLLQTAKKADKKRICHLKHQMSDLIFCPSAYLRCLIILAKYYLSVNSYTNNEHASWDKRILNIKNYINKHQDE